VIGMSGIGGADRSRPTKAVDWWLARVWPDLALVALLTLVHFVLYHLWQWDHVNFAI